MRSANLSVFALWDALVWWSRPWLPFGLDGSSNIPQFILDVQHPWVEANREQLEMTPNIAAHLCQVDPAFNINNDIPHDLFQRLEIDNHRVGIRRYGWRNALDRLRELRDCPGALEGVETLDVDIFIHKGREPLNPPSALLDLLVDILASMPNLRAIRWDMSCEQTPLFREVFTTRNVKLPSVQNLTAGPYSEYLVPLCPNLEALAYSPNAYYCDWNVRHGRPCPRELLIKASARNKHLTSFTMSVRPDVWSRSDLEGSSVMYSFIQGTS